MTRHNNLWQLRLKARKFNSKQGKSLRKAKKEAQEALKGRQGTINGLISQTKDVSKISKALGDEALKNARALIKKQREDYGRLSMEKEKSNKTTSYSKPQDISAMFKRKKKSAKEQTNHLIRLKHNANYANDEIVQASLEPQYSVHAIKNTITKGAYERVKEQYKDLELKEVDGTYNQSPTYSIDYSKVPKNKKKAARNAIRRERRRLSTKDAVWVSKLMRTIRNVYFNGKRIEGSDRVFQQVLEVVKFTEVNEDNIGEIADNVMNKVNED